jgi:autotransporter-associated beta strand protein
VASGATSLKGIIKGTGMLVKTGAGQLNITYGGANTWSGGTQLKAGTLAMGTWNTTFGVATSKIEVLGNSTIRVFDNNSTSAVPTLNNTIDVMSGKTLTIETGKRCAIRGKLTGKGNVKISFPYVRGDVYTNMSAFEGVFESTGGQLRLASAIDLSKGTLKLGAGVYAAHVKGGSGDEQVLTSKVGKLESSATDCTLASGVWNVGYLGENSTYAGVFNSAATLNKYGEGDLTLTGASSGKLNIYAGRVLVGNTSAATTSGQITVNAGGTLAGTGKAASVIVNKGGVIGAGKSNYSVGTLTLTGSLNVKSGAIIYLRARGTTKLSNDKLDVAGKITLNSPVFKMEHMNGEFKEGDEMKFFVGDGAITLSGEPVFEPAVPAPGYLWDYSTLATDGTIRVVADPVGIDDIEVDADGKQDVYDLTGRKLRNANGKGVYIINGKKIAK